MMKQKDAVFQAVSNVYKVEQGTAVSLTKETKAQVMSILVEGFKAGSISYEGELPEEAELRSYCNGLLSNWLRKDSRLNGGVKYETKNPGSRAGSTDPQIKAMRILLSTKTDPQERAEIQGFIDKRLIELKAAQTTKVEINVEDLPEELRKLI